MVNRNAEPPPASSHLDRSPATEDNLPDYEKIRPALEHSVKRVCPAWMAASQEDIVQASLLRVVQARGKKGGKGRVPASYLWRTAYTATLDEIRSIRRRHETPMERDGSWTCTAGTAWDPAAWRERQELGRAIQHCWIRLRAGRKTVLGLYLLGHGPTEIGDLLGWKTKRVTNLLYRGLRDLRSCLRRKGIGP